MTPDELSQTARDVTAVLPAEINAFELALLVTFILDAYGLSDEDKEMFVEVLEEEMNGFGGLLQ